MMVRVVAGSCASFKAIRREHVKIISHFYPEFFASTIKTTDDYTQDWDACGAVFVAPSILTTMLDKFGW